MPKKVAKPCNADTTTGQIPPQLFTIEGILGCSSSDFETVDCILKAFHYRNTVWQYGINRSEMWCLLALNGYLKMNRKVLCSHDKFIDNLSGNFNHRAKIAGFMKGLFRLGCIGSFEYARHPGSLSVGISDHGFMIIRAYYKSMADFFARYVTTDDLQDDKLRTISVAENIPVYYNARQSA